jgi:hypothetical protein
MTIHDKTAQAANEVRLLKLARLYETVPSGKCGGCTDCCSESVNISFLEFSNIVENGLPSLSEIEFDALVKRVLSYYLLEWVKPQKCPFLGDDKRCVIYETRPLPCRIFGTPTRAAYEVNYGKIQRQNIDVALQIQTETGCKLPKSIVRRKIAFCEDFIPDKTLELRDVETRYSKLINLDGELYFAGLIDDSVMNGDLVSFMIDWLIETQKKSLQMAVTRELLFELKKDVLKSIQK